MLRLLIFVGFGILSCQADCNVCSALSGVACTSDTTFKFCDSTNLPIGTAVSCPVGYYCTANTTICSTKAGLKSCNECKVCSSDKRFACLTSRTFALCMGSENAGYLTYNITGSCAENYVCNLNDPYICSPAASGSAASCPNGTDNGTIDPIDYTPTQYCQLVQQAGRFPYGVTVSTTCKQYISCYIYNSTWYGSLYSCPGSTYFDSATRICITSIPARCTTGVNYLRLDNLVLV